MTGGRWSGEIVGHRGAAGLAPENTMAAFEAAIAAGADRVEMDVRRTVDGEAVVFHDANLDRFVPVEPGASRSRPVSQLTLAQLRAVDVGLASGRPGCGVPTLDEVLEGIAGRVKVNLEVKGTGADATLALEACLRAVERHGLRGTAVVSSFHADVLRQAQLASPHVARGLIVNGREREDYVAAAAHLRCRSIHAEQFLVTEHLRARCREAGLQLQAWTVNDSTAMERFMALGLDGIITDFPDRLRALARD